METSEFLWSFLAAAAAVTGLFLLPGYLLARALIPRQVESVADSLAISAVLGIGLMILPAVGALWLGLSLDQLLLIDVGIILLLVAQDFLRRHEQGRWWPRVREEAAGGGSSLERRTLQFAVAAGVVALLWTTLKTAAVLGWAGDLWVYLAYVSSYLDGPHLTSAGTLNSSYDARFATSGWLVLQALVSRVSSVDSVDLNSIFLPPLWLLISMAGFYVFAKSVCRRTEVALFCCGVQLLYLLTTLTRTVFARDPGYSLVVRINEDKIAVWMLLLPPVLALCLNAFRDRRSGSGRSLVAIGVAVAAVAFTHPIGIAILGLSLGSFVLGLLVRELLSEGPRKILRRLVAQSGGSMVSAIGGAVLVTLGLAAALAARRFLVEAGFGSAFDVSGSASGLRALGDRFVVVFEAHSYRLSWSRLDDAFILAAFAATPFLVTIARRSTGALFLLTNMVVPLVLLFNTWTAPLVGNLVAPTQLWRLAWVWPVSLTLGFVLYGLIQRLGRGLRRLPWRWSHRHGIRWLLPAAALLVASVGFHDAIRQGLWFLRSNSLQNRMEPDRRDVLEVLGRQAAPEAVVLASPLMSFNLHAFLPRARPLTIRLQPHRVAREVEEWLAADRLNEKSLEMLRRYSVTYVVTAAESPLVGDLDRLRSIFKRRYDNASFVIHEVLPCNGATDSADALYLRGDLQSAIEAYDIPPKDPAAKAMVWLAIGEERRMDGETGSAVEAYRQAIRLDASFVWPRLALAGTYVEQALASQDPRSSLAATQAFSLLEETLSLAPDHRQIHLAVIDACRVLGDCGLEGELLTGLLSGYEDEIRGRPTGVRPYRRLAEAYTSLGFETESTRVWSDALEHWPWWGEGRVELARSLLAAGRRIEARDELERAIDDDPALASAYFVLIRELPTEAPVDKMVRKLRRVTRRHLALSWPRIVLGRVYLELQGEPGRAIDELERAFAGDPDNGQAHIFLDRAYRELDVSERAMAFYEKLIADNPKSRRALLSLASVRISAGQENRAIELLNGSVDSLADDREWCRLYVVALSAQSHEVAPQAAVYERVIESGRAASWVYRDLARLLTTRGLLPEAREVAEAGATLSTSLEARAGLIAAQAAIALAEDKSDLAASLLRQAVAADPEDAAHHFDLGRALARSGRVEEARLAFETVSRLESRSSRWQQRVRSKLQELDQPSQ